MGPVASQQAIRSPGRGYLAGVSALAPGVAALATVSAVVGPGIHAVATGVAVSYAARGAYCAAGAAHPRSREWRVLRLGVLADMAVAVTLLTAVWLQSLVALVPFTLTLLLLVTERVAARRLARPGP